ncbi:unnamed protein product [Strongylus vulgaris]|uniref:Galectin n=1 Tax=Strongylus vulgaris TaxID=40348 RepID=A0A3P7K2R4_STRVU|nr:unnamed protein product [Strongylus vulgaris]
MKLEQSLITDQSQEWRRHPDALQSSTQGRKRLLTSYTFQDIFPKTPQAASSDKLLVFNSYYMGSWQYEERPEAVFPFEKKHIYTVEVVASSNNSTLVYVNGQFLYEFRQRQTASVSTIEVGGDVYIHSVQLR